MATMFQLDPRSDLTRLAGLAVWLSVGIFLPLCTDPSISPVATAILYLLFGGLFLAGSDKRMPNRPGIGLALLLCQTSAALLLMRIHPYFLMTGLLVITGWQIALRLELRQALLLIIGQTLAGGLLLAGSITLPLLVSSGRDGDRVPALRLGLRRSHAAGARRTGGRWLRR